MESKCKTPKPRSHEKVIKAWADGARILEKGTDGEYHLRAVPGFSPSGHYIVDPVCDYAKSKITELGEDGVIYKYLYWLEGGGLQMSSFINGKVGDVQDALPPGEDPFKQFMDYMEGYSEFLKNRRIVKFVRWICAKSYMDGNCSYLPWVDIPIDQEKPLLEDMREYEECHKMIKDKWHKVPTLTREVLK